MKTFDDLTFENSPEGIKRAKMKFGNYTLSVILEPSKSLYEVAIFNDEGRFIQLPGIHRVPQEEEDWIDDVIPYLSPEAVTGIMKKLQSLR